MTAETPPNSLPPRSFSLSIGQLTFGSFMLVLAVIIITSTASVIAIRHIDSTFAELQRLQSVGDLAEDIDRRMTELRLAARDFVTDPGTQSVQVGEAATSLSEVLKKTRLELAPEQQDMIDGVTERLATYRSGIERISSLINRRAEMIVALPPLREKFDTAIGDSPDPILTATLIRAVSAGEKNASLPQTHVDNEIGDIARAAEVFRQTLVDADAAREAAVRALAEQRLAEESYRKLFEDSIDGIYVTTPGGALLNANPALARMMGHATPQDLVNGIGDIADTVYVHPEARAEYERLMQRDGMIREYEYQVRTRSGSVLWLSDSASAVHNEAGVIVRYEGTVRDITDQKRAEDAIAEGRRLLQMVIDTVPAVINVKDKELRYVLMNRYMAGIFGVEPGDAIGRTTAELMSRYGAEKTDEPDKRVLAAGKELGFYEEEYKDASGHMRQWLVNKLPILDAAGGIENIVTVALDIAERKRVESEMRKAKDAAEGALRN